MKKNDILRIRKEASRIANYSIDWLLYELGLFDEQLQTERDVKIQTVIKDLFSLKRALNIENNKNSGKALTIEELREQFEKSHDCSEEYLESKRKRRPDGVVYYIDDYVRRDWLGYQQCAKVNGILKV